MGAVDPDVEGVSFSSKTWTTIPFVKLQGHGSSSMDEGADMF
jgi:hypothetical protein